jgi:hypothetical protein
VFFYTYSNNRKLSISAMEITPLVAQLAQTIYASQNKQIPKREILSKSKQPFLKKAQAIVSQY